MPTVKKETPKGPARGKKTSFEDRIQSLDANLQDRGVKLNVYGPSGSGKTTFAATFPKPILWLVASGGKEPGELISINTAAYRKTIKTFMLQHSNEIDEAIQFMNQPDCPYKTLVLDHSTGLQDMIMVELLGLAEAPVQLSWGFATREQWGAIGIQVKERLRALLSLKQNVVIIAQQREFNTEGDSSVMMPFVASALSPSVVGWLQPAVDYICQTYKKQRTRIVKNVVAGKTVEQKQTVPGADFVLRVGPDPVYTTKIRSPKGSQDLPDVIIDPTYDKLMEIINGG